MYKFFTAFIKVLAVAVILSVPDMAEAEVFNILKYKAVPDDATDNTAAIQQAVDDCASHGGGVVMVPAGVFATSMIRLKDHVNLNLESGAVLKALPGKKDYVSLILIEEANDVSVTGQGTLFGNGGSFTVAESAPGRPHILFAKNSRNINIRDITLKNSASWTLRLFGCEQVRVSGVSIYSHANFNNDGIDIDSKDVIISGCRIDCSDDAICLKSEDPLRFCENVTITNCIVASNCNLIKMGTGSVTGFKNITISNCVLHAASESPLHQWSKNPAHFIDEKITGLSGIALEMVDGGIMDRINISNISMTGVQTPIFIRLGNRKGNFGVLKNVIISNISATSHSRISSIIAGIPGAYIENVTLRDIFIDCKGEGVDADYRRPVPEKEKEYPENRMFGWTTPAFGLYVRHVKNLMLDNIQLSLRKADARAALWLDDAHDVTVSNTSASPSAGGTDWLKQVNCTNVQLTNNGAIK